MIQREALTGLQKNMAGLAELQRQLSSGRRITKPSDDPVGIGTSLEASSSLRALTQYQRNLESARTRQSLEEQNLNELSDILTRAKELGVQEGTATASVETRAAAKAEVDRLLDFALSVSNSQFGGRYFYGGEYSDQQPFPTTTPNPLAPPSGELQVEVGPGQVVGTNHSGQAVFVDTGLFTALEELSTALGANDGAAVRDSLTAIDTAFGGVQELIGDLGARQNTLEITSQNLDALEVNLESLRSSIQDTDFERAVTELVGRQSTFQAALAANAQILGQSLTDYL